MRATGDDDLTGFLRTTLARWGAGEITERQVHELAEERWESFPKGPPNHPHNDPRSIPIEVLSQLEILNEQLITREDIPAFVDFLATPRGREEDGWMRLESYWDSVDFDARLRQLADNPYYSKSRPRRTVR